MASFGQFLATFWQLFGQFWRGVANLLSILAAAKQVVYSKEYTVSGIPRALLVGLLIEVLGLHLMDPGMDQRAAVFFCSQSTNVESNKPRFQQGFLKESNKPRFQQCTK